jgi:hypothetical protein
MFGVGCWLLDVSKEIIYALTTEAAMNDDELKQLETKLRSWQPRRPSPALKWRLAVASGTFLHRTARLGGMLIPAAACLLLAILSFNANSAFSGAHIHTPLLAINSSNQNAEIYWPALDGSGENRPLPEIFKWTNASGSPSSMRSRQSGIN